MANQIRPIGKLEIKKMFEDFERKIGKMFNEELERIRERIIKLEDRAYFVHGQTSTLKVCNK